MQKRRDAIELHLREGRGRDCLGVDPFTLQQQTDTCVMA